MFQINVTQEHIDNGGNTNNSWWTACPIALAMEAAIGEKCWVGNWACGLTSKDVRWMLPKEARRFVELFDSFGKSKVAPFTFTLE